MSQKKSLPGVFLSIGAFIVIGLSVLSEALPSSANSPLTGVFNLVQSFLKEVLAFRVCLIPTRYAVLGGSRIQGEEKILQGLF